MQRIGFTSGSFDPPTNGHLDVMARAARMVDVLVVGVGVHPGKAPMFTTQERIEMLQAETAPIAKATGCSFKIVTFDNLTIDAARTEGATLIVRGLRDGTDFDYEMQMAGMNGRMAPDIETVFLPAAPEARHVTGTLVRQIAMMGGNISPFVSSAVAMRLQAKAAERKQG